MIDSESRSRFLSFLQQTRAFYISVKFTRVLILSLSVRSVCVVPLAESEGTLILPQVESYHRLQDDDATTVTSEDSFFSAAEVRSFICSLKTKKTQCCRCIHTCAAFTPCADLCVVSPCSCLMPCLSKRSTSHLSQQLSMKKLCLWFERAKWPIGP